MSASSRRRASPIAERLGWLRCRVLPSAQDILGLAPDPRAAATARRTAGPRGWHNPSRSERAIWAAFEGSATYRVAATLGPGTAWRCTCPSRKQPCKHVLGLLLRAAEHPDELVVRSEPDWLVSWLAGREERLARKKGATDAPSAEQRGARDARREATVQAALPALRRLLSDLARDGLAAAEARPYGWWDLAARRLVDAQAPGLAARVGRMAELAGSGDDWPERLLELVGKVALLAEALEHLDRLPDDLREEVLQRAGRRITRAEVLDRGERVEDTWLVVSRIDEDLDRVVQRRTWLWGAASERPALHLQHAVPGRGFEHALTVGHAVRGPLVFYPGARPSRVLVPERLDVAGPPPLDASSLAELLTRFAGALADNPWTVGELFLVAGTPVADGWRFVDADGSVPLVGPNPRLLAASAGRPLPVFGLWNGHVLTPLTAQAQGRWIPLGRSASAARGVDVDPFVKAALIGLDAAEPRPTSAAEELVDHDDRAWRSLLRAGARATWRRAGTMLGPLPELPAPADLAGRAPSAALAGAWQDAEGDGELIALLAELHARHDVEHPVEVLSTRDDPGTTPRSRWLHAQLGDAPPEDLDEAWELGTPDERRAAFDEQRRRAPAAARERVEASWDATRAAERTQWVQRLSTGLGPDDEPFLERCLDDRSKHVRAAAAELLTRLDSALVRRNTARLVALRLELPASYHPSWARDGIREEPVRLGPRSWWLAQLLAGSDPVRLAAELGWTPREIVERLPELTRPWLYQALARHPDPTWAEARLSGAVPLERSDAALVATLTPERRRGHLGRLLADPRPDPTALRLLLDATELDAPLGRALIARLRAEVASTQRGRPWWAALAGPAARALPDALLGDTDLNEPYGEEPLWTVLAPWRRVTGVRRRASKALADMESP